LLCFGSLSLLVSALLLILSALSERPNLRLHFRDRPRKVGQLTRDKGYVLLGCHFAQESMAAGGQNQSGLRGDRHGPRSGEFQREPTEDREVGVKTDALDATDAKHRQGVVVLQATELSLDGGATTVEPLPFVALARQGGLAETAIPAKRDHCGHVPLGALGVDAAVVVAHVHRGRQRREAASAQGVEQRRDVVGLMAAGWNVAHTAKHAVRCQSVKTSQVDPLEPTAQGSFRNTGPADGYLAWRGVGVWEDWLVSGLTSEERSAVEQAADVYLAAMKAADWVRVAQSFSEDGVRIPPNEDAHRGREAIQGWLGGIEELTSYELTRDRIDGADGIAYVRGRYEITLRPLGAPAPLSDQGDFLEIWRKESDGGWRIIEAMWNTRLPQST
jgi:ketosteroid isomerase-like protein